LVLIEIEGLLLINHPQTATSMAVDNAIRFRVTGESEQSGSMAALPSIGQVLKGRASAYTIVKELHRAVDNGVVFLAT